MHETKRKIRKVVEGAQHRPGLEVEKKQKTKWTREKKKQQKNKSGNKQQMANCKTYFLHLMIEKTTRNSSTLSLSLSLSLSLYHMPVNFMQSSVLFNNITHLE